MYHLSQRKFINQESIEADTLRMFYAELLLARSMYKTSEHTVLKSVLYLKCSMSWQVGAVPCSYTFLLNSTRAKQRKLQIEKMKDQTVSIDESSSDSNKDDIQSLDLANIKVRVSMLTRSFSFCLWMNYLECFVNCHLQRSNTQIEFTQTFHLI